MFKEIEPENLRALNKEELFALRDEFQVKVRSLKIDIEHISAEIDFRISLQQMKRAGM